MRIDGGMPPSPEHMTTGMPSTSFRYVMPMASPSHMWGERAPMDMEPMRIGKISRTGGMNV